MTIKPKNPFQSILERHPYLSLDKRLPLPGDEDYYIFNKDSESQFTLESIQVENFKSIISSEIDVSNT